MCIRGNIGGRWSSVSPRGLFKLVCKGDLQALLIPSKEGWINHSNILGDLWILLVEFYIINLCLTLSRNGKLIWTEMF